MVTRGMGLDWEALSFLAAARSSGVSFERSATLGRQTVAASRTRVAEAYALAGVPLGRTPRVVRGWVDPILEDFGATAVVSIDASDYEGATYLHDLNHPVPDDLAGRFTMVLDGGTLEHVFDVPTALRNCMRMVAPGGHLLLVSPVNNEAGHGFYQFSPELFYRTLSPPYGFRVEQMLLLEHRRGGPRWYSVADPDEVGSRAQFRTRSVAYLYVRARRIGSVPPFDPAPQQSDYSARWDERWHRPAEGAGLVPLVRRVVSRVPYAKSLYLRWRPNTRVWYKRQDYRRLSTHFRPMTGPADVSVGPRS